MAQSVISQYESGTRDPSVSAMERLLNSVGETLCTAEQDTQPRLDQGVFRQLLEFGASFRRDEQKHQDLPPMNHVWEKARERSRGIAV